MSIIVEFFIVFFSSLGILSFAFMLWRLCAPPARRSGLVFALGRPRVPSCLTRASQRTAQADSTGLTDFGILLFCDDPGDEELLWAQLIAEKHGCILVKEHKNI